jgi:hypothetical protein
MILLTDSQKRTLKNDLKKDGICVIWGVGTISKKPARKGKINGIFGAKLLFKERLSFKFSMKLKDKVLKKSK